MNWQKTLLSVVLLAVLIPANADKLQMECTKEQEHKIASAIIDDIFDGDKDEKDEPNKPVAIRITINVHVFHANGEIAYPQQILFIATLYHKGKVISEKRVEKWTGKDATAVVSVTFPRVYADDEIYYEWIPPSMEYGPLDSNGISTLVVKDNAGKLSFAEMTSYEFDDSLKVFKVGWNKDYLIK